MRRSGGTTGETAAGNKPNEQAAAAASIDEKLKEPVTINFFYNGYSGSLMEEWKARIKEKYNIILNPYLNETIENLIASGVKLDLIAYSAGGLFKALDLQLVSWPSLRAASIATKRSRSSRSSSRTKCRPRALASDAFPF
jgi:hypothetical protein